MATYKGIKGFTIQNLSADPPSPTIGDVWYNSTSNKLKGYANVSGAWATGTAAPTPGNQAGAAGITTAYLKWGGSAPGPNANSMTYDGSTWTSSNALVNAQSGTSGLGIQTAALGVGGYGPGPYNNRTEVFDGTCWATANADGNKPGVGYVGLTGTQTAGLSVAGYGSPPGQVNLVSEYDGTNWSAGNVFPAAMSSVFAIGTQTAAVVVGGSPPTRVLGFDYDGTSWTAGDSINTARADGQAGGINTAGIIAGGSAPAKTGKTETYDGSSWTEVADMATPRNSIADGYANVASATTSFICATGDDGSKTTAVEEWSEGPTVVTFTSS